MADEGKDRGLGDTVARVIQKVTGGRVKPCDGCKRRQAKLNELVPYGQGEESAENSPVDKSLPKSVGDQRSQIRRLRRSRLR